MDVYFSGKFTALKKDPKNRRFQINSKFAYISHALIIKLIVIIIIIHNIYIALNLHSIF